MVMFVMFCKEHILLILVLIKSQKDSPIDSLLVLSTRFTESLKYWWERLKRDIVVFI